MNKQLIMEELYREFDNHSEFEQNEMEKLKQVLSSIQKKDASNQIEDEIFNIICNISNHYIDLCMNYFFELFKIQ